MQTRPSRSCTAFAGTERIASGTLKDVAVAAKPVVDSMDSRRVLIFDDTTAEPVEMDFRGTLQDVVARFESEVAPDAANAKAAPEGRSPGRPKLGVTSREVTLLPRHWEWLKAQPGGASVALRKLVEHARRHNGTNDRIVRAREAAYKFMSAMAGDETGFEEATRALFAGHSERFERFIGSWPSDVRDYTRRLATDAFASRDIKLKNGRV